MKTEEYISSGILELYVLGCLSDEEMIRVTSDIHSSAELLAEVERIEHALINFAEEHAPSKTADFDESLYFDSKSPGKVLPIEQPASSSERGTAGWWKYLTAASMFLLLGTAFLFLQQRSTVSELSAELEKVKSSKAELQKELKDKTAEAEQLAEELSTVAGPGTRKIELKGTDNSPKSLAIVYWNPKQETVNVDLNNLPPAPAGKVYQLWSLSSMDPLTPHDAGLLTPNDERNILKAKTVGQAKASAITLEPSGGSKAPTLSELYVLGQIPEA